MHKLSPALSPVIVFLTVTALAAQEYPEERVARIMSVPTRFAFGSASAPRSDSYRWTNRARSSLTW